MACVCVYETAKRERETELERKRVFFFSFIVTNYLSLQLSIVCDTNPSGCLVIKEAKEKKICCLSSPIIRRRLASHWGGEKKDGSHGHRHGFTETLVKKG